MNFSENITGIDSQSNEILSRELAQQIYFGIAGMTLNICTLGIICNIINVVTFASLGLQDGVTLCFFALSCSDLCAAMLMAHLVVLSLIRNWKGDLIGGLRINDLTFLAVQYYRMYYDISVVTTTFIAVQRGCCVAFPFQFKGVFTRNKNLIVILFIYVIEIACYIPLYTSAGLMSISSPVNTTQLTLYFKDEYPSVTAINDIMNKMVLVFSSQTLVILSLIVISIGLKSSKKFRSAMSQSSEKLNTNTDKRSELKQNAQRKTKPKLMDHKVIQQVILVSTMYVICNTPQVIISLAGRLVPEFFIYERYTNLFLLSYSIVNMFEVTSSSFNFFIYLTFNKKFKEVLSAKCV